MARSRARVRGQLSMARTITRVRKPEVHWDADLARTDPEVQRMRARRGSVEWARRCHAGIRGWGE